MYRFARGVVHTCCLSTFLRDLLTAEWPLAVARTAAAPAPARKSTSGAVRATSNLASKQNQRGESTQRAELHLALQNDSVSEKGIGSLELKSTQFASGNTP